MPNRKTHTDVGVYAGAATAAYKARNADNAVDFFAELAGGAIGGYFGALAPDKIDPPTSPNHRSTGHGIVPLAAAGRFAWERLPSAQQMLRDEADRRRQLAQQAASPLLSFWHFLVGALCRVGAGAAAGFIGGYASHVALDARTPASLPLLY